MSPLGPGALRVRERTPPGRGGVSVLSLEGPGALARVLALAPDVRPERTGPQLAQLADGGVRLEQALVVVRDEATVEVHLHGSPPLVGRVLALLGGPSDPCPGTSLEERALELLAGAPCEAGARILLDQAEGALCRGLSELAGADGGALERRVAALLEAARASAPALRPARVVLAGPANAGKSTLFNALFGARRVVTSGELGTTRDAVVERVRLGAWPVDLVDTAGEREVPGSDAREPGSDAREVELAGQAAGREARTRADLVLWLHPADEPGAPPALPGDVPHAVVRSCADRAEGGASMPRALSALRDPEGAARTVREVFQEALGLSADPWVPGRPVPFEPALAAALRSLPGRSAAGRAEVLGDLLAR